MVNIKILSGFNNYYNRQVKLPGNQPVINYSPYVVYEETGVNFVPNDWVDTQHVFGNQLNSYDGTGDYLIVVSEDNEIDSRWFIIESVRDRAGQYTLTLRRDLVADYYNKIVDESTFFIEKATLSQTDPFIYNKENNMSFNQIKTNEWQLMDKTKCAWIIGFVNREFEGFRETDSESSSLTPTQIKITNPPAYATESVPLERTQLYINRTNMYVPYYQIDLYLSSPAEYAIGLRLNRKYTLISGVSNQWAMTSVDDLNEWNENTSGTENYISKSPEEVLRILNSLSANTNKTILNQAYEKYISNKGNKTEFDELRNWNGQVFGAEGGSKLYNVSTEESSNIKPYKVTTDLGTIDGIPSLKTYFNQLLGAKPSIKVTAYELIIKLNFTETQEGFISYQVPPPAERRMLEDAPYDMFCIPYGNFYYEDEEGVEKQSFNKQNALTFSQQLAEKLGTNLFDLQLLPYCPIINYLQIEYEGIVSGHRTFNLENLEKNKDYQILDTLGNRNLIIFWSKVSRGEINASNLYYKEWNIQNLETTLQNTSEGLPESIKQLPSITNTKIANECNMFRLCSPNWNGQFEFNPTKFSNNTFNGFNVDFTYLPYSSYIHVNPVFSGLYGQDYNDARGLICQGDFSISYESDAFVQYQINNKNYLNIFNKQIQNMEITQSVQRDQQIFNAIVGTVMGGAAGATMGSKAGGPGSITGGVIGSVMSAVGGAMDIGYGEMLRNEALDYTKDLFGYQLDNIKALPDSIAKVTAYTENNKLFPTLEYYTCTDTEKRALANKIAYNGMTVMRIGQLSEFIGNKWSYAGIESKGYIKGKLIRFPVYVNELGDDYHIVNAISGELNKGVFIE